jgi:RNA polymerase primary sigma factor
MNTVSDTRDTVRSYLADIASTKPLSREREVELAARIKEGDMEARDELVKANLLFVVSVARPFQHCGVPLSDLIGAGNLGLMIAAERFDGTKGYKFISYAVWWIRQSILVAIAEQPRVVRLPMSQIGLMQKMATRRKRLESGQDRDVEEWAEALGVSVERVTEALVSEARLRSLDREWGEEREGRSLADVVADPHQPLPDAEALQASDQAHLERLLSVLDNREQYVLRLYFGFEGGDPLTLEQIGRTLGLTRERVRQLKEKALAKLTHGAPFQELRALGEE